MERDKQIDSGSCENCNSHRDKQIEEMAKAKMLFFTTDGELAKYNGTDVEIIRPLTEKECDVEDVGFMYKARFYDGCERDVFEDELIDTDIKRIATKICSNFNDGICCVDCSVCILNCEYKLLAEHLYNAGYRKASDVAREIFEEIESIVDKRTAWNGNIYNLLLKRDFAELKKKYTEGEK